MKFIRGEFGVEEKLEYLRQKLYSAIDEGNADEIIKASQECDVEIVKIMRNNLTIDMENDSL